MNDRIRAAVARHLGKTQRFLCELIANPSLSGEEGPAMAESDSDDGEKSSSYQRSVLPTRDKP